MNVPGTRSSLLRAIFFLCSIAVLSGTTLNSARADQITGNQFVFATVTDDGWGHVTWYEGNVTPGVSKGKNLSYVGNFSYLQLLIGGQYYINSDLAPTKTGPPEVITGKPPDVLLNNGTNRKIGDTIYTTWSRGNF